MGDNRLAASGITLWFALMNAQSHADHRNLSEVAFTDSRRSDCRIPPFGPRRLCQVLPGRRGTGDHKGVGGGRNEAQVDAFGVCLCGCGWQGRRFHSIFARWIMVRLCRGNHLPDICRRGRSIKRGHQADGQGGHGDRDDGGPLHGGLAPRHRREPGQPPPPEGAQASSRANLDGGGPGAERTTHERTPFDGYSCPDNANPLQLVLAPQFPGLHHDLDGRGLALHGSAL